MEVIKGAWQYRGLGSAHGIVLGSLGAWERSLTFKVTARVGGCLDQGGILGKRGS